MEGSAPTRGTSRTYATCSPEHQLVHRLNQPACSLAPTDHLVMTEALHVYRSLLRAVNSNITSVNGNKRWRDFVVSEFKKHKGDQNPAEVQQRLQEAKDWAFLITSVREHKELLLSYNIGIDVETREKEMNQRAANLVGLAIPPKAE